ncbi:MAG TPA: TIGR03936 family radical SAM-associated protein, partial [Candidatus Eisenbacteria bacterium]
TAVRGGAGPLTVRFGIGWPGETAADRASLIHLVKRLKVEAGITAGQRLIVDVSPYVPTPGSALSAAKGAEAFDAVRESEAVTGALTGEAGVSVRVVPAELAAIESRLLMGGREIGARLVAAADRGAMTPDPIRPWDPATWIEAFAPSSGESRIDWWKGDWSPTSGGGSVPSPPVVNDTPIVTTQPPSAALPLTADTAGYGRKSRRKAPASMRPASRYRVRFAKTEALRYTSHLDVGRLVERALSRLERTRPAWYNRSVKLSFGPPLPLGWTGEDEFVDLLFPEDVPETLPQALMEVLPAGIEMIDVKPIRASVESLSHAIDRARYSIPLRPEWLDAGGAEPGSRLARLTESVARLKSAREILVRKSPDDEINRLDVRPGVLGAQVEMNARGEACLALHLTLGVPGSVRPEVLLAHLLGDDAETARLAPVHRAALRIAGNGKEFSPMEVVELDFPWWRESARRTAAGGPRA